MKIDVSDVVYRKLQDLAKPFEDTANDVILRLLDAEEAKESKKTNIPQQPSVVAGDLISRGGRVPAGTKLKAKYRSRIFMAEIGNGSVLWNGNSYSSLSDAAVAVIQSTGSPRATEDGWRFWMYEDRSDNRWKPIDELRDQAKSRD